MGVRSCWDVVHLHRLLWAGVVLNVIAIFLGIVTAAILGAFKDLVRCTYQITHIQLWKSNVFGYEGEREITHIQLWKSNVFGFTIYRFDFSQMYISVWFHKLLTYLLNSPPKC